MHNNEEMRKRGERGKNVADDTDCVDISMGTFGGLRLVCPELLVSRPGLPDMWERS